MSCPSACTASIRQERAVMPSNKMVQAPQTPCSQPRWVPVRPNVWRRKSASVSRTSASAVYDLPFTVSVILRVSVMILPGSSRHLGGVPRRDAVARLLECAAREHGRELLAVSRGGMHVLERVELAAGFAQVPQRLVVGHAADQRLLDLAYAHRRDRDAAERDRGARDLAVAVVGEQSRRRHD